MTSGRAAPLVVYVEDVDDDGTLIAAHLRRAGQALTRERVDTCNYS